MIRVVILGATGYTGIELIRLLLNHKKVKIQAASSRQWAGSSASSLFPYISNQNDFPIKSIDQLMTNPETDYAFLALPHGESFNVIRPLLDKGIKVIDLSADCRLTDLETYREWYGEHKDPELLKLSVYGLPEIKRDLIKGAKLIANPGCYPTTVILGLAPILKSDIADVLRPIVDSKSGVSGAGRGAKLNTSFCESGEGFKPYGVIRHRHIPEMEQELSVIAGKAVKVRFTPHLIPVSRGMVSTIYVPMKTDVTVSSLREAYANFYNSEPFVKILPAELQPDTVKVRGSNQCHIAVEVDDRTRLIIITVALDNLVKGASGAAIQNMNVMAGIDETEGLLGIPLFP
ncbi:MAG: N-acetyl-gamma-glutamyl-phosphate reductase [Desulfomonilaceae bacterium]